MKSVITSKKGIRMKKVSIALTLLALIMSPAHTLSSSEQMTNSSFNKTNSRIKDAKSTFRTFQRDIKCAFTREGCTTEQKKRLLKQGIALLGITALLAGGWFALKARGERIQAEARAAQLEAAQRAAEETAERLAREQATEEAARQEATAATAEEAAKQAAAERLAAKIAALEKEFAEKQAAYDAAVQTRDTAQKALDAAQSRLQDPLKFGLGMGWGKKEQDDLNEAQTKLNAAEEALKRAEAALEEARAAK
jgi:hypothetical protein